MKKMLGDVDSCSRGLIRIISELRTMLIVQIGKDGKLKILRKTAQTLHLSKSDGSRKEGALGMMDALDKFEDAVSKISDFARDLVFGLLHCAPHGQGDSDVDLDPYKANPALVSETVNDLAFVASMVVLQCNGEVNPIID